jgi:hypothetical protein
VLQLEKAGAIDCAFEGGVGPDLGLPGEHGTPRCMEMEECFASNMGFPRTGLTCANDGEIWCADQVLTLCAGMHTSGLGYLHKYDCASRAAECKTVTDGTEPTEHLGCFPAGCALWGPQPRQWCEGSVLVSEGPFSNAATGQKAAVRVDCTSFGYAGCRVASPDDARCSYEVP